MIYIASDHGGFEMKQDIVAWLSAQKLPHKDLGPVVFSENDDYPEYAEKVAKFVSKNVEHDLGILICRSGIGVSIVANKFKGVRASLCWNEQIAKSARVDDGANILCLPADYVSLETAELITRIWLETPSSNAPRHLRRISEITNLER
jgi:RpiB/LacA/LacB family sugar-phosphate isomerase